MADITTKHHPLAPGDIPIKFKDLGDGTYAQYLALEPASIGGGGGGPSTSVTLADAVTASQKAAVSAAGAVKVDGSASVQPVSGTFWQGTQPVSLATNTPDVTDRAGRLLGHVTVDNVSIPVTGSFFQATQPVSLATNTPDVTDRAARLLGHVTVDSAPTTAVTGAFFQATQPVSIASAVDVSDRAARLLGVVDKGKLWDGTNIAAVKAASALAVAADPALVVQHAPQRPDASNLAVTATAATGVAATLTLPAPGAGLFHYISLIELELYATAARTGGATPVIVTTTNLPGSPAWDFDTGQAIGTTIRKMVQPATPIKSSAANVATTVVAPIATTGIWRLTAYYYTAP